MNRLGPVAMSGRNGIAVKGHPGSGRPTPPGALEPAGVVASINGGPGQRAALVAGRARSGSSRSPDYSPSSSAGWSGWSPSEAVSRSRTGGRAGSGLLTSPIGCCWSPRTGAQT